MVAPQAQADETALIAWFRDRDNDVLVAFSGGVDSALVLAAAVRALGNERVLAVTAVSASLAVRERALASAFARELDVAHEWVETRELDDARYRANARDRCYHCKAELLDVLSALDPGARTVCTGTNADDVVDPYRPGIKAAAARGANTPLADVGLSKLRVRALAAYWGLSVADKPAQACLASRIAYGQEVTADVLAAVDRAETAIRRRYLFAGWPLQHLRVRVLADRACIEVDRDALPRLVPSARLTRLVRRAGIDREVVDVTEFRSGGLNLLPVQRPATVAVSRAQ